MSIFDNEENEQQPEEEYIPQDNAAPDDVDDVGLDFRSNEHGQIFTGGHHVGGLDLPNDVDPVLQDHLLNRYSPAQVQAFQAIDRKRERAAGLHVEPEAPPEPVHVGCPCGCGAKKLAEDAPFDAFVDDPDQGPMVVYAWNCGNRTAVNAYDLPQPVLHRYLNDVELVEGVEEEHNIPKLKKRR
jgi:hypothetical protein